MGFRLHAMALCRGFLSFFYKMKLLFALGLDSRLIPLRICDTFPSGKNM